MSGYTHDPDAPGIIATDDEATAKAHGLTEWNDELGQWTAPQQQDGDVECSHRVGDEGRRQAGYAYFGAGEADDAAHSPRADQAGAEPAYVPNDRPGGESSVRSGAEDFSAVDQRLADAPRDEDGNVLLDERGDSPADPNALVPGNARAEDIDDLTAEDEGDEQPVETDAEGYVDTEPADDEDDEEQ